MKRLESVPRGMNRRVRPAPWEELYRQACGTGGLLLTLLIRIKEEISKTEPRKMEKLDEAFEMIANGLDLLEEIYEWVTPTERDREEQIRRVTTRKSGSSVLKRLKEWWGRRQG